MDASSVQDALQNALSILQQATQGTQAAGTTAATTPTSG
jgi:hypothetical protein